ncbi:hypothetical protein [Kitasatospora sp. NPDC058190]|uniref:hypothetical protein n=1 Tax=Kitasatospora sp. NPDC058190 TaxID=3346371 RepID=UPI0036D9CCAD
MAEAIVEFATDWYPVFVADALDSGLALAAGQPPPTTAVVYLQGSQLTKLVLVGGREVWEPSSPVEITAGWLSAAEARGAIVLIVVPPGTWPTDLLELPPHVRDDVFTAALEDAYEAGQVLHGSARLTAADPITGSHPG